MSNELVEFLNIEANKNGFEVFEQIFGEINLNEAQPIKQSSGAVYGIIVESAEPPRLGLLAIEGYPNLYPVYWGKDIAPVSRLKAHVQNHQNTGNANLRGINEIAGKRLIFGAIFVSQYQNFESHLHTAYPPLKGTNRAGKQSQLIEIMN